jgi:hypothetical protein
MPDDMIARRDHVLQFLAISGNVHELNICRQRIKSGCRRLRRFITASFSAVRPASQAFAHRSLLDIVTRTRA